MQRLIEFFNKKIDDKKQPKNIRLSQNKDNALSLTGKKESDSEESKKIGQEGKEDILKDGHDKWLKYYDAKKNELNLRGQIRSGNSIKEISDFLEFLKKHPEITSLNLSDNNLGYYGGLKTLSAGLNQTNITVLDLSSNRIIDKDAVSFGSTLTSNTTLTSLNLHDNYIHDKGAAALARISTLTWLDLSVNYIGDEGAKAFACNTKLTCLDLWHNCISDVGEKLISHVLKQDNKWFKYYDAKKRNLDLSGKIRKKDIHDLLEFLEQHPEITSLDLCCNDGRVDDETAEALATNTTLTSLNISWTSISDEGAKKLANHTNLIDINTGFGDLGNGLWDSNIGPEGAKILYDATERNRALRLKRDRENQKLEISPGKKDASIYTQTHAFYNTTKNKNVDNNNNHTQVIQPTLRK